MNEGNRPRIYSIGHSSRSIDGLLELLASYRIERLADVRSFPSSRLHPQFSRTALEDALNQRGIDYVYLGGDLGGFRDVSYEEHMTSESFRRGLAELERVAHLGPSVFMCAEKSPWQCHRRFIAQELASRGWHVLHILDRETLWDPEQALFSTSGDV
jgi:uncharacterized protein (DUF488 family)